MAETPFPPIYCCGCEACKNACPKCCITMVNDREGFGYPSIDHTACINCGICRKVCPVINDKTTTEPQHIYAAYNKNLPIRLSSSSGGVFYAIARWVLSQQGAVYGAAFDNNWDVKHIRVTEPDKLHLLLGSKYVQSSIGNTLKSVQKDLQEDLFVLFSGTPCQIAGLKNLIKRHDKKLLTVEVICHGVPSPKVWRKYLNEELFFFQENKTDQNNDIREISFRDKQNGWLNYGMNITVSSQKEGHGQTTNIYSKHVDNPYMKGFLGHLYLRPSCHHCNNKGFSSGADISLGDAWGIDHYLPKLFDDKGISLCCINTDFGNSVINCLNDCNFTELTNHNLRLIHSTAYESVSPHPKRNKFFKLFNKGDLTISQIVTKLLPPPTYVDKIIWSIKKRIKNFFK